MAEQVGYGGTNISSPYQPMFGGVTVALNSHNSKATAVLGTGSEIISALTRPYPPEVRAALANVIGVVLVPTKSPAAYDPPTESVTDAVMVAGELTVNSPT